MKTIFAALILSALVSTCAFAQLVPDPNWSLKDVQGKDKTTVGYIYHTAAIGTTKTSEKITKVATGLRLVCSLKGGEPIIAIYWNGANFSGTEYVATEVDGVMIEMDDIWMQDANLTYKFLDKSRPLLQTMRTGKYVKFSWTGKDGAKQATMFSLRGFESNFANFSTVCKISL